MFFTKDDLKKIEDYLRDKGIRDSDFEYLKSIDGNEEVAIIKDGKNYRISVGNFVTNSVVIGENGNWYINKVDTGIKAQGEDGKDGTSVNILGSYESEEALREEHPTGNVGDGYLVQGDLYVWLQDIQDWKNVGSIQGPQGITPKIRVQDNNLQVSYNDGSTWETIQSDLVPEASLATNTKIGGIKAEPKTDSDTVEARIDSSTGKLYVAPIGGSTIEYINNPDDEDLKEESVSDKKVIKFADKEYNSGNFSGLGRVYLRKNISSEKNILTQDMINKPNIRYIIQYDYDLNGESINIPANCIIHFEGGSLKNGIITGDDTSIISNLKTIFKENITLNGTWNIDNIYPEWFGCKADNSFDNTSNLNMLFGSIKNIDSNKNIVFSSGTYITGTISIQGIPNISLCGKSTILKYNKEESIINTDNIIKVTSPEKDIENISIKGIKFYGGWSNINIESTNSYFIKDVTVSNCSFYKTKSGALWIDHCKSVLVSNNIVCEGGDNGIYCPYCEDVSILGNIVYNCYGSGGIVVGYRDSEYKEGFLGGRNILVSSNNIFANYQEAGSQNQYGIDVVMAENVTVSNNTIYTNPNSLRKIGNGIAIEEWTCKNINVINNVINNIREFSIGLAHATSPDSLCVSNINISGNIINGANYGIKLNKNSIDVLIKNNDIRNIEKSGVYIGNTCCSVDITNNKLTDCGLQSTWTEPAILNNGKDIRIENNSFYDTQFGGILTYTGDGTAKYKIDANSNLILLVNDSEIFNEQIKDITWDKLRTKITANDGFSFELINSSENITIKKLRRTGPRRNDTVLTLNVNSSYITTPEACWYIQENGENTIIKNNSIVTNANRLPSNIAYNGDSLIVYYQKEAKKTDLFERLSKTLNYAVDLNKLTIDGVYVNYNIGVGITNKPSSLQTPFTLIVTNKDNNNVIQEIFSNSNNIVYKRIRNGGEWQSWMYVENSINKLGSTVNRPTVAYDGFCYFDTDKNKALWKKGSNWVDSEGNIS